jgi:CRISPR system Cascade subunit CasC
MKIELHILQNFAPSNLNRDDTGAPKDCELGGFRRARISSQCQKRAVREAFRLEGLVETAERGARTKRLAERVAEGLQGQQPPEGNRPRSDDLELACFALECLGLGFERGNDENDALKSEYLLFLPERHINKLVEVIQEKREELLTLAKDSLGAGKRTAPSKEQKKKNRQRLKGDTKKCFEQVLKDCAKTPDLALFGRMIADNPDWNVEASCQVAHAVSTNRVQMDFDFFTAVDDFKPGDTAGSDMMGTVQFNSSCFYRYAVLDTDALAVNLGSGAEGKPLTPKAVDAFVRAFIAAIPTGKQNTFAAHNPPSYVLAVVREKGQAVSLTNAFLKPARPRGEDVDLVDDSVAKLEDYFTRLGEIVGTDRKLAVAWADRDLSKKETPGIKRAGTFTGLLADVTSALVGAA